MYTYNGPAVFAKTYVALKFVDDDDDDDVSFRNYSLTHPPYLIFDPISIGMLLRASSQFSPFSYKTVLPPVAGGTCNGKGTIFLPVTCQRLYLLAADGGCGGYTRYSGVSLSLLRSSAVDCSHALWTLHSPRATHDLFRALLQNIIWQSCVCIRHW